ncbi:tRNA-guanine transglycosylase, partial [Planctomycetota bacterium]
VDMFDCVMPTRNARNGSVFTRRGRLNLRNRRFERDLGPMDDRCDCHACQTVSRSYMRHLFQAKEMLAAILASMHNLRFYLRLMEEAREAIRAQRFSEFRNGFVADTTQGQAE